MPLRKLIPLIFSALLVAALALPAPAAVISRDWKTPGDGLLTYDDVNRREWLDLSETLLEQFPGAVPGATLEVDLEERYQNAVAELSEGGEFAGFAVGKRGDVVALAGSAGIDTETRDFGSNGASTVALIGALGKTLERRAGRLDSYAFLDEPGSPFQPQPSRLAMILDFDPPEGSFNSGKAGIIFGGDDPISKSTIGIMLYRHAVPEPSLGIPAVICISIMSLLHYRCFLNA